MAIDMYTGNLLVSEFKCAVTTNEVLHVYTTIIKKIHNYICQFNIDRDVSILQTNHLSEGSAIDLMYFSNEIADTISILLPGDRLGRELQKHCKRYYTIHCHTQTAAQVTRSSLFPRLHPAFCSL